MKNGSKIKVRYSYCASLTCCTRQTWHLPLANRWPFVNKTHCLYTIHVQTDGHVGHSQHQTAFVFFKDKPPYSIHWRKKCQRNSVYWQRGQLQTFHIVPISSEEQNRYKYMLSLFFLAQTSLFLLTLNCHIIADDLSLQLNLEHFLASHLEFKQFSSTALRGI